VQLFHYHLVTSSLRQLEARYIGKLGFRLVARYGRLGERHASYEPGVSWDDLDRIGFKLRLSELERGAVNVAVQPGHWRLPRIDHLGLVLEEDDFASVIAHALEKGFSVKEHGGRRTFVATGAGYRLELHPPREWIEELLNDADDLRLGELHMRTDDPARNVLALANILDLPAYGADVHVGDTLVRFLPGGPEGRPELHAERFL
jgi:hypothetical protein